MSCVRSKRRCDLALPCCYRCRVRSLDCCYQSDKSSAPVHEEVDIQDPLPWLVSNGGRLSESGQAQQTATEPYTDECEDQSLPSFPDYNLDWPDVMGEIESFLVSDQIRPNDSPDNGVLAGEIYQGRIIYAVKRIKSYPSLFVSKGSTPFIHWNLYAEQIPLAIQDALGCCALYDRKSELNQNLVYRTINQKASLLVAESLKPWSSPTEQLAALQALILYQIICLFDGDIRLRADAEKADSILTSWTQQLKRRMQPVNAALLDDLTTALSSGEMTGNSWQSWIFAESLRRTVIISYTLQGLYSFLKNGWDNSHHEFQNLSFYAQTELWLAPSDYAWRSAMRERRKLPVCFSTWDVDIIDAAPSDMEDLGIMMMALIKGVDQCSHWIGHQNFERFGLEPKGDTNRT